MAGEARLDKARPERSVIVVDDDSSVRDLCADALLEAGYRVDAYARGDEALQALASAAVRVLIVDWKMPGLDGAEVARRARALHPRLPVLMITGNRLDAAPVATRAGIRHILDKPFRMEEFVATVNALADGVPTP